MRFVSADCACGPSCRYEDVDVAGTAYADGYLNVDFTPRANGLCAQLGSRVWM